MIVVWTAAALGRLAVIQEWISQTSPFYAERTVQRILHRGPQLATFPESGRVVPETAGPEVREVFELSYRVIYRVATERVEVLP